MLDNRISCGEAKCYFVVMQFFSRKCTLNHDVFTSTKLKICISNHMDESAIWKKVAR